MSRLTSAKVRALNSPGLYSAGQTLFLRVAPEGSKQWVQRLVIRKKRGDLGLGSAVLEWVVVNGYKTDNPVNALKLAFPKAANLKGQFQDDSP